MDAGYQALYMYNIYWRHNQELGSTERRSWRCRANWRNGTVIGTSIPYNQWKYFTNFSNFFFHLDISRDSFEKANYCRYGVNHRAVDPTVHESDSRTRIKGSGVRFRFESLLPPWTIYTALTNTCTVLCTRSRLPSTLCSKTGRMPRVSSTLSRNIENYMKTR